MDIQIPGIWLVMGETQKIGIMLDSPLRERDDALRSMSRLDLLLLKTRLEYALGLVERDLDLRDVMTIKGDPAL